MNARPYIIGLVAGSISGAAIGFINVWMGVAVFAIVIGVCSWIGFEQELDEKKVSDIPPQEYFDKHYSNRKEK
jgi:hypothetical protein